MQSRQCRRGEARGVPPRRREPAELRRAVDVGRTCSPRSAARTIPPTSTRAIALARDAGFERINVDLIYGTPGESIDDWRATLEGAIALGVPHVSAYALTVEPATPLGIRVAAGAAAPDDDVQADAYLARRRAARRRAGLEWYEVSNWARPGEECRHNLLYWSEGEYLGIGCAAHGHTGRPPLVERAHARALHRRDRRPAPPREAGSERLDPQPRAEEACALALRTRRRRAGGRGRGRRGRRARRRPVSCAGSTTGSCSRLTAGSSRPM